jgi:hypothetical protein
MLAPVVRSGGLRTTLARVTGLRYLPGRPSLRQNECIAVNRKAIAVSGGKSEKSGQHGEYRFNARVDV